MSDESDAEKTEPASQKRIDDARKEGDVPRSRELATFTVLMTSGVGLWVFGSSLIRQLSASLVSGLTLDREQIYNSDVLLNRVTTDIGSVLVACLPLAVAIMAVALD